MTHATRHDERGARSVSVSAPTLFSRRRPLRLGPLATLLVGALVATGCDGGDAKPAADVVADVVTGAPALTRVVTSLDATVIPAGGEVVVTCEGFDQYEAPFASPLSWEVVGGDGQVPEGAVVEGDRLTVAHAGVYRVRCFSVGPPRIEDVSAVELTVEAGEVASVHTSLFLTNLVAGDSVAVGCTVKDALGNAAAAQTVAQVTPTDGVTITGRTVRFVAAGTFDVVCALADGSLVAEDPVTVTVRPGKLTQLRTVLSRDTITPGEEVVITCPGEDAFGNAVELAQVFTLAVDGIDWLDETRLRVTSTRSGTYALACTPKEAWVKVAEVPASLTVNPGPPVALELGVTPERAVYNLDAAVRCYPRLVDAWDNPVPEVGDGLETEARFGGVLEQTAPSGERVFLNAEGVWTLSVATGAPWNLSTSRTLVVDASAPSINVTWPERGAMITTNGGSITVTGTITDPTGGLAEVRINGAAQAVTPGTNSWPISFPYSSRHGLNVLTIEAVDVNGFRTNLAQSFINASGYKPPGQRFDQGIIAHLAKDFIDDGVRGSAPDDLATIFLRVINGIDIASFIPSPVVTYAGYDVYLESLTYGAPTLSITPALGQLDLRLAIPNLRVDVDADGFIDVSGSVTASKIDIRMQVLLSVVNGQPRAAAGATIVDVQGFNIDVHWSINWLINFFENTVRDSLSDAFADTMRQQVPEVLGDALSALALSESFALPAFLPGMQPVTIDLSARPTDIHLTTAGLDLDLGTAATTLKRVPWSAPGSLTRGGCFGTDGGQPGWSGEKRIGFGLSLDVLNQVLFSVWWGGALEIALGPEAFGDTDLSQYGVADLAVTLSGKLPPILTDCLDGELYLQIGELEVDASMTLAGMPLEVGMIVALETVAEISADADGTLGLTIGTIEPDEVVIDIVRIESDLFSEAQEEILVTLLREQLLAGLLGDLAGQSLAGFPLPEIDLGSVADDLAGQVISIRDVTVERERGYVQLEGNP